MAGSQAAAEVQRRSWLNWSVEDHPAEVLFKKAALCENLEKRAFYAGF
jgi:hypothetical protein